MAGVLFLIGGQNIDGEMLGLQEIGMHPGCRAQTKQDQQRIKRYRCEGIDGNSGRLARRVAAGRDGDSCTETA